MRKAPGAELAALFEETVALYHRLTADAAAIHRYGSMSGPRRTILVALAAGPQTVAHMARARAQARQRLQPLVNRLIADGLVEARSNPMHVRSPLMVLTAGGEKTVKQIVATEGALRARLRPTVSPGRVALAAVVLRDVRMVLENQLPQLLRGLQRQSRTGLPAAGKRAALPRSHR